MARWGIVAQGGAGQDAGHPVVPLLKQPAEKSKQQNINIL